MSEIKIYHRVQSKTQTIEIARLQEKNLEIWGSPPRNIYFSDIPKVKAYVGSLGNKKGIEFTTDVEPDLGSPPDQAYWTGTRQEVELREENGIQYAILKVLSIKLNY